MTDEEAIAMQQEIANTPVAVAVPGAPEKFTRSDQHIWNNGNVFHPPGSEFAKERQKWEAFPSAFGPALRPHVQRDYPTSMYLAKAKDAGGFEITAQRNDVPNANVRSKLESDGWRITPLDAIKYIEDQQREFARLAAERNYEKRHKLSPRARAEVEAKEEAVGSRHLPTIEEVPIVRRRRRGA